MPRFLDLFAGAGGLSEGFVQAGYTPIAHIEMNQAACYTLKTRAAFHWLESNLPGKIYQDYLSGRISRDDFYRAVPSEVLDTVLNYEISEDSLPEIFSKVDSLRKGASIDLIVGGPPCQAYSVVGRSRSETNMVGDKRNYLYKLYARFLQEYRPKVFVFENVLGLKSAKEEDGTPHFENMQRLFQDCGYSTAYEVLNAYDYGVLQNRRRIILIGKQINKRSKKTQAYYPNIPVNRYDGVTVSELFRDLPKIQAGEGTFKPQPTRPYSGSYLYDVNIKSARDEEKTVSLHWARSHTQRDLEIYKTAVELWNKKQLRLQYSDLPENLQTHRNKSTFLDRFKVVAGNLPYAQTVVAHISKDGHYYIHPDVNQNRSLTPREAARIQTFPDNYYFESNAPLPGRTEAFRQIGNAVPVRLAYSIAQALRENWD